MSLIATLNSGQRRCQAFSIGKDGLVIQCSKGLSDLSYDTHTFCKRCIRKLYNNDRSCSPETRCPQCIKWPLEKMYMLKAKPSYRKRKQASLEKKEREAKQARLSRRDQFELSGQSRLTVTEDQRVRLTKANCSDNVNLAMSLHGSKPGSSD